MDGFKEDRASHIDATHITDGRRPLKTIHLLRIHRDRMKCGGKLSEGA